VHINTRGVHISSGGLYFKKKPANGELRKFQSSTNPPFYKSNGLVENLNGFKSAG